MRSTILLLRSAALAAAVAVALASAAGCGNDHARPTAPLVQPPRAYHFEVRQALTDAALPGAQVKARTTDSTLVVKTDATGQATLVVPNELTLPPHLVVTIDAPGCLATAVRLPTDEGVEQSVKVALDVSPAHVLLRETTLVHLGDGMPDDAFDDLQVPPDSTTMSILFLVSGIPATMPSYHLAVRGLQAPAELLIDGHVVGTLAPSADPSALVLLAGQLGGSPAQVFESTTLNVFQVRTVPLPGRADNLDDFELAALAVFLP